MLNFVETLLSKFDNGKSGLMNAVNLGCEKTIEAIFYSSNPEEELFKVDDDGRTALFYGAAKGNCEILWLLLKQLPGTGMFCSRGKLLEARDKFGKLAEDIAEENGNEEARKLLNLERGRIRYFE